MIGPETTLQLAAASIAIEAVVGYPDALFRSLGHPVTWMGWWLGILDRRLNDETSTFRLRQAAGVLALLLLLAPVAAATVFVTALLGGSWFGLAVLAMLAASLPAQRSLDRHVAAVAIALERDGLAAGRRAVAMIVGRNPDVLDEAAIARAAIESLAENFSDGLVAPALWIAVLGLPGGALYKAANTADSMIGHRTPRYAAFGWAAARFDDLVNLPASRLSALWLLLASLLTGGATDAAWRAVRRDASRHRSPNAGWPEAAMAGALGLRLGGPRVYGATLVQDSYMGDGRAEAGAGDIRRALTLYRAACVVQWVALAVVATVLRL